ncbi:hypothetical protein CPJCM30710_13880 [Clostridium polyendosporum]|uniref:Uncharacterized protein n=1 Tax=Clostridium polyendosporum TaxID=69208 RepID=A0A919RYB3_9CLOT|nr:hypothetical protein [Clostridium polyendosporum]GIM28722.1 hypothetical protein CPJCM30710_13880 [Clostridium polyendosporum]
MTKEKNKPKEALIPNKPTLPNEPYLPDERDFYKPDEHSLKSKSKVDDSYSPLPSPVEDDIVSQNIAYNEFDYTDKTLWKD